MPAEASEAGRCNAGEAGYVVSPTPQKGNVRIGRESEAGVKVWPRRRQGDLEEVGGGAGNGGSEPPRNEARFEPAAESGPPAGQAPCTAQDDVALRRQCDLAVSVLDSIGLILVVLDPQGRVVRVNRSFETLTGYSLDEIRGEAFLDRFIVPEERDAVRAEVERLGAGHVPGSFRSHLLRRDGARRLVAWSCTALSDSTGTIRYLIGAGTDVTEQAAAEAELRETKERLQAVFDASPLPIIALDPDCRVTIWNQAAERVFGWRAEEVIGKPYPAVPPEEREDFWESWSRLLSSKAVSGRPARRMRKDGTRLDVRLSAAPMRDAQGRVTGTMGVLEDVTERLREARELEEARERALQAEVDKKRFYSEIIRLVTHNRFCLVDPPEIPTPGPPAVEVRLDHRAGYLTLRREVRRLAQTAGMSRERAEDLVLAAGEAATNAIKHASGGVGTIYVTPEGLAVRITDHGTGIRPERIPATVLMPGFSTEVSLGMGYTIMLQLADRVWLATGPDGTTVQLEKWLRPREAAPLPAPAVWERL